MPDHNEKSINILELPNEVLSEILSFVSDQLTLGQVCKDFYNISCRLKTYRLNISNGSTFKSGIDLEDDDETYQNILWSDRRIDSLYITSFNNKKTLHRTKLRKVIEHIGGNVKELQISNRSFNKQGLNLLNLMPNLKKLHLDGNTCDGLKVPQDFKLRLNNLKLLLIEGMPAEILEIFDSLPDNVLHVLTLKGIQRSESSLKYFSNQHSLKHVDLGFNMDVESFSIPKLKLKSLGANISSKYREILRGQDEMTTLSVYNESVDQEMLEFICQEMKSLQYIYLGLDCLKTFVDFSEIKKLQHLKRLYLGSIDTRSLETIRCKNLLSLKVSELPEEALMTLSANCPSLLELKIWRLKENFAIDELFRYFPKLQNFSYFWGTLKIPDGWENKSLRRLTKYGNATNIYTIEFMKRCKSLKTLYAPEWFVPERMSHVLTEVPHLKMLCLRHEQKRVAEIVKEYGGNLESVHFSFSSTDRDLKTAEEVKEILKDRFPVIKLKRGIQIVDVLMRTHENVKVCCERLTLM